MRRSSPGSVKNSVAGVSPDEVPTPGGEAGILLWDKPAGITSHDLVEEVRKQTGLKAGHAGTLDPFATGLMVILLGRATRLQQYLVGLPKRYRAVARLGWTSDTGDPDGNLEETGRIPATLAIPTGSREQMVPMTSAVRVEGERLYRKARRGEVLDQRPTRMVTVQRADLLETELDSTGTPTRASFDLEVSSGTYVRELISGLGDAYCEELRRTAIGELELDRAGELIDLVEALSFMPRVDLDRAQAEAVGHGVAISVGGSSVPEGEEVVLVEAGEVVSVGRETAGEIRPEIVIRPASG